MRKIYRPVKERKILFRYNYEINNIFSRSESRDGDRWKEWIIQSNCVEADFEETERERDYEMEGNLRDKRTVRWRNVYKIKCLQVL